MNILKLQLMEQPQPVIGVRIQRSMPIGLEKPFHRRGWPIGGVGPPPQRKDIETAKDGQEEDQKRDQQPFHNKAKLAVQQIAEKVFGNSSASFLRKQQSSLCKAFWAPAFAGVTVVNWDFSHPF
jgi:hypothetical protein